jgi:hypothetical protein
MAQAPVLALQKPLQNREEYPVQFGPIRVPLTELTIPVSFSSRIFPSTPVSPNPAE